ncbi:MAG: hypothetical protein ACREF3_13980, partial [Acetobacteraceae bacterium]
MSRRKPIRLIGRIVGVLAVVLCLPAGGTHTQTLPAPAAWSCTSGDYRATRSVNDITGGPISRGDRPGFSVAGFAQAGFAIVVAQMRAMQNPGVVMRRTFRVVSLDGPFLGLRDDAYVDFARAAHPGGATRFWTIDLRRSTPIHVDPDDPLMAPAAGGPVLALTDIATQSAVRNALAADPLVRRLAPHPPDHLPAFLDALGDGAMRLPDACMSVPPDILTRFVIAAVSSGDIIVRLGFPGAGNCRYR